MMITLKNSKSAVLLILPLLFLFLIISCDSDNNMLVPDSEAQEPVPNLEEEAAMGCPCFTVDDVETLGNNSNTVECGVAVFGMALLPDSSPTSALTVDCLNDGTMCQCSNGGTTMDITQNEFKACMSNIVTGLIRYNDQGLKTVSCE